MSNKTRETYMQRCIELANKAFGHTSPNPLVGCVIVKGNKVIAEGYHKKAGEAHAEAAALKKARAKAKGAELYVNLEPCSHHGRTPPCADAIIKAGIKKVYAAMRDPNPKVAGRGFAKLKKAGIKVETGIMEKEAKYLNRIFAHNIVTNRPYVIMKSAMSLDGKMALNNGESKWITSEGARKEAQKLRLLCDAILVGVNTVINDNPYLDCRIDKRKRLKKVVLDTHGRMPLKANIFRYADPKDIIIFTNDMPNKKCENFKARGVNVVKVKAQNSGLDEKTVLEMLCGFNVRSVLLEGGPSVIASFLKKQLGDEAHFHIAPLIMGADAMGFSPSLGFTKVSQAYRIEAWPPYSVGPDTFISGRVKYV